MRLLVLTCILFAAGGARTETAAAAPEFKVQVFYARHGQSCSNAAPRFDIGLDYIDPPLTDCGLYRSLQSGNKFQHYLNDHQIILDFKGASRLLRAQETLLMMAYDDFFTGKETLYPLPYIGEAVAGFGAFPQNSPLSLKNQKVLLSQSFPTLNKLVVSDKYTAGTDVSIVNYKMFIREILPKIALDLYQANPKNLYRALIITHSQFMLNSIGCVNEKGDAPFNNEIYSVFYRFKQDGPGITLVSYSSCEPVTRENRPWSNTKANNIDRNRCSYTRQIGMSGPFPHPFNFSSGSAVREAYVAHQLTQQCKR